MTEKTIGIMDQLRVDAAQKRKLEDLDKKRIVLAEEDKKDLSKYKENVGKIVEGKADANVENLTELDKSVQRGKQHQVEMVEVAESLTTELRQLGEFFTGLGEYQGLESMLAKVGLAKWADRRQLSRVKNADVKESYQTIIDYGHMVVTRLYDSLVENTNSHAAINEAIIETASKLQQNQPKYEEAREKREKLERSLGEIQDKQDKSTGAEYANLAQEREAREKEVQEARIDENHYFTIVNKAKQALPIQRTHLKAFGQIIDALMQLRTGLEQSLENVTTIYQQTPVAIQTALRVKGASKYDSALNYTTDRSTDVLTQSVKGVLDEVGKRLERPLIEPERLEAYRKAQIEMDEKFRQVVEKVKKNYDSVPVAS